MFQPIAPAEVTLDSLGDQPRLSESKHARRARFHQSWYRVARLGEYTWGRTTAGRPLGSILPAAASVAGKNFASPDAQALFIQRRKQGWGVDPLRMTSHMTSSQTLLVNLLGPLAADTDWLLEVLRIVLGRPDLTQIVSVAIEFAPPARSRYLGDMTRIDAFFVVRTPDTDEGIVLELKYTDRFSSRKMPLAGSLPYLQLADDTGLWRTPHLTLTDDVISQLVRCHALGVRSLQVDHSQTLPVTLLLVNHPCDLAATVVFERYREHLADPDTARQVDLDQFLLASAAVAPGSSGTRAIEELRLRYLAHEESELLWREHLESRQSARGKGPLV